MARGQRNESSAYLVGGGIAALASAVYLIREGGLVGEVIHIFEQDRVAGGALDGSGSPQHGYLIRGGRMIEDHFVCTWNLLSGIPSLDEPNRTVKDECNEFNRRFVSESHCRLLRDGAKVDVSSYGLSNRDRVDMLKLMFRSEESLGHSRIEDCFSPAFFKTNFWLLWQTTFAFQTWSSAAEMRRYFIRFIHLLPGFNQLKGILRTVYNQYDSVILPIERWLKDRGVNLMLQTCVTDIEFDLKGESKAATAIRYVQDGEEQRIELDDGAYVFITNGSMVDGSSTGSMTSAPALRSKTDAGAWMLWERIAKKSSDFGRPSTFCDHVDLSKWESFTVTLKDSRF
ncbi:MAG: oleate hydratase, partial [Gammaproteobacteria bacterium]|nr:oleate hydratase [Gammaproteobacteria bacterium]